MLSLSDNNELLSPKVAARFTYWTGWGVLTFDLLSTDEIVAGVIELVVVVGAGKEELGSWWSLRHFMMVEEGSFEAVRGFDMNSTLVKWIVAIEGRGRALCAVGCDIVSGGGAEAVEV
jgi:hypothetical protein